MRLNSYWKSGNEIVPRIIERKDLENSSADEFEEVGWKRRERKTLQNKELDKCSRFSRDR